MTNMTKHKIKIFPARAYIDYNTEYEEEYINSLKERYPDSDIIELPNLDDLHKDKSARFGVGLFNKERDHFFKLIDDCDILTVARINNEFNKDMSRRNDKGKLSEGVKDEILYCLSINKRVYKWDINKKNTADEFQEIKSISDDEDLIKQIVVLNKQYNVLTNFPKMQYLIKTEKRLNIHPKIVDFLFRNKKVRDIIRGFLSPDEDHKDCVRPIAIQYRYPFIKDLTSPVRYVPLNYLRKTLTRGSNNIPLTINHLNKDILMRPDREGELHFYECFFDKTVSDAKSLDMEIEQKIKEINVTKENKDDNYEPNMVFDNHITGIGIVFDIDAPPDANIFNKKWWPEFMALKDGVIAYVHDDLDLKCIVSTTGNGLNVSCEPYWFDERDDNFYDFKYMIHDDIEELNILYGSVLKCRTGKGSKGKGVAIDNSSISWSIYKKLFFGYSAKRYKMTIPIYKEEDDREWVEQISDIDYFLSNEKENVDEVIMRSRIEKDKWW